MPYDARMPLAPGRAYALRMPGGPTGGPYGSKSKTIWNDEFIATEIGQIGTQMDALGHLGCMCGARGDKTNMLFYNGNRLADMWSPYGLKNLGIENAPPFFTRGVLFDVQGLKGRVLDVGEEIRLADLKGLSRAPERRRRKRSRRATRSSSDRPRIALVHRRRETFYDGAPGHRPRMRALVLEPTKFASSEPIISPSRSCRRSTRTSFTPVTSTSSWRAAFIFRKA